MRTVSPESRIARTSDIAATISEGFSPPMTSSRHSTAGSVASARDFETLEVADWKRHRERSGPSPEARALEDVRHAPARIRAAPPSRPEVGADRHVRLDGHVAKRARDLVRPHESARDDGIVGKARDLPSVEPDRARGRRQRSDEAGEESRLACAVRADDAEDLALGDREAHVRESEKPPEPLLERLHGKDRLRHRRRSAGGAG